MSINLHSIAPGVAPVHAVGSGQRSAPVNGADFHSLLGMSGRTAVAVTKLSVATHLVPGFSVPTTRISGTIPRAATPATATPATATPSAATASASSVAATPAVTVAPAPVYGLPDASGKATVTGQTATYSLPSPDGLTWDQYWGEIENLNIPAVVNSSTTNPTDVSTRTAVWEAAETAYVSDPYSAHNLTPDQLAQFNAKGTNTA